MKHKERRLFQKNTIGFLFLLVFIILNTIYSIYTLNSMGKDYYLGSFVMQTIFLLLLGFLTAVKVQTYSFGWAVTAIVLGFYQGSRIFFTQTMMQGGDLFAMNLILLLSAAASIAGGILSVIWTKERSQTIAEQEKIDG